VHDGIRVEAVLPQEPGEVHADSAYAAGRFTQVIQARGGFHGWSIPTAGAAGQHWPASRLGTPRFMPCAVGGRLLLAFFGVSAFAVLATAVAVYAFLQVGASHAR